MKVTLFKVPTVHSALQHMINMAYTRSSIQNAFKAIKEKHSFKYDMLKPEQEQVTLNVLSKQSTCAVLPTGYGKSDMFFLPPLMQDQVCLHVRLNIYQSYPAFTNMIAGLLFPFIQYHSSKCTHFNYK